MISRALLKGALLAAGIPLAWTAQLPLRAADPPARPSFVIILADDMGYGDSSVYGGWIKTPQLERLASEGLRFTDFHSSGHVCSPTRAGLLTGRYQQRAGIPGVVYADPRRPEHRTGLREEEITLAESFREAGYATGLFGKWHLGYLDRFNPTRHGFDQFRGYVSGNVDYHSHRDNQDRPDWWNGSERIEEQGYTTHLITRHAVDFIRAHRAKPFLLYIAHEAVHDPYQGPADPPVRGPDKAPSDQPRRPVREIYREMMHEMDRGIGEVLDALDQLQLSARTLIFFFSDNGANRQGSNHPWRGHKGTHWEGGHRVPAIARWTGHIPAGRSTDQTAISLDLMPTFLDLAGLKPAADRPLDGLSLRPVLLEGGGLPSRRLFWNGRAMREENWKLIRNQPGLEGVGLFDLARDPGETRNLAGQHPERVRAMTAALDAWEKEVGPAPGRGNYP